VNFRGMFCRDLLALYFILFQVMSTEIILRYVRFISIFAIVGSLISEHLLLKKELTRQELDRLSRIDAVYGIAAVVLVVAGLTLWLGSIGKPAVYYTKNWIFLTKIGLFSLIGILSIYPTVFYVKSRKGNPEEEIQIQSAIFWMLRLELLLPFIIPLLAGLMARGVGFFG
jgi:putative membrane protein